MISTFMILVAGSFLFVKAQNGCTTICAPQTCPTTIACAIKGMERRPANESCLCCDICIPYAEIGDFCNKTMPEPGQINLRQRCRPPLICANNVCLPRDYFDDPSTSSV